MMPETLGRIMMDAFKALFSILIRLQYYFKDPLWLVESLKPSLMESPAGISLLGCFHE
jgi:hypothetical protein